MWVTGFCATAVGVPLVAIMPFVLFVTLMFCMIFVIFVPLMIVVIFMTVVIFVIHMIGVIFVALMVVIMRVTFVTVILVRVFLMTFCCVIMRIMRIIVMVLIVMGRVIVIMPPFKTDPFAERQQRHAFRFHQCQLARIRCQSVKRFSQPRGQSGSYPDHQICLAQAARFGGAHRVTMRRRTWGNHQIRRADPLHHAGNKAVYRRNIDSNNRHFGPRHGRQKEQSKGE
jgi:hypothetical protein